MQEVKRALNEVKDLYHKVTGQPAPELGGQFVAFPPGVDPIHHAIDEVDALKRLSEQTAAPQPVSWVPAVDSYALDDGVLFRMEVPGVDRDRLKVLVAGAECVVRGERRLEDTPELRPLAMERARGPFERRFPLPAGCRPEAVTAKYTDGVLELKVAVDKDGSQSETEVKVA